MKSLIEKWLFDAKRGRVELDGKFLTWTECQIVAEVLEAMLKELTSGSGQ